MTDLADPKEIEECEALLGIKEEEDYQGPESIGQQTKRYINTKGASTRIEIVKSLSKRFNWIENSVYNKIRKMLHEGELWEDPDTKLIWLEEPPKQSNFIQFGDVIRELISEEALTYDTLPFDELNKEIRGMELGETALYIAPGSKGKTAFLTQSAISASEQVPTMWLTTREGTAYKVVARIASYVLKRRIEVEDLRELGKKAMKGDKEARGDLKKIGPVVKRCNCKHFELVKFNKREIKIALEEFERENGEPPKAIVADYIKDSHTEAIESNRDYGKFAEAIEEILGFCRAHKISLITAHQDRNRDRYPEQPDLYGATNAIDAMEIVLWQQGTVENSLTNVATNRIKIQKNKRGDEGVYFITKVDMRSYRQLSCEGPFNEKESSSRLDEEKAKLETGIDFDKPMVSSRKSRNNNFKQYKERI